VASTVNSTVNENRGRDPRQPANDESAGQVVKHIVDWRIAELLTWSRGWTQTTGMTRRAAVSETLAHLVHLQGQHRVVNNRLDGVDAWLPGPRTAR
jgi:hypothetical protein